MELLCDMKSLASHRWWPPHLADLKRAHDKLWFFTFYSCPQSWTLHFYQSAIWHSLPQVYHGLEKAVKASQTWPGWHQALRVKISSDRGPSESRKSSSVFCYQLKNSGQLQLWGNQVFKEKGVLAWSLKCHHCNPLTPRCAVRTHSLSGSGPSLLDQSRSPEATKMQNHLGCPVEMRPETRLYTCRCVPCALGRLFEAPHRKFQNNHTRSMVLASTFLQMREVRPREVYPLPKTWSPEMNDSILTSDSIFSQPEHRSASCEISRRGPMQRKAENKPRGVPLSRKTVPCTDFVFALFS